MSSASSRGCAGCASCTPTRATLRMTLLTRSLTTPRLDGGGGGKEVGSGFSEGSPTASRFGRRGRSASESPSGAAALRAGRRHPEQHAAPRAGRGTQSRALHPEQGPLHPELASGVTAGVRAPGTMRLVRKCVHTHITGRVRPTSGGLQVWGPTSGGQEIWGLSSVGAREHWRRREWRQHDQGAGCRLSADQHSQVP
eukprot:361255-Chlamydomonas_euryale.AAC.11